ncbi:MAG: ABC transporter permease subunit [Ruminococcus sp.]|nr:ABC transporter permease subunit [Ruminococcus sp.]
MKAFLKKEWMEWSRTGRLLILLLVFVLFGIMNPAVAKLIPWLMETMSESLADTGLIITEVTVDAMDSWMQFYKNIPMALIVFVLLCSGGFTSEYEKGTLIPVVAKGLSRRKIIAAKALFLYGSWTVLYLLCAGITYGYNAYFWDNSVAENLIFATVCTWLFGVWVIALLLFFSAAAQNSPQVLLGTGGVAVGVYVLGMFPKLSPYLPAKLMDGMSLLQGISNREDYHASMAAAGGMIILCMALAVVCFDRKRL